MCIRDRDIARQNLLRQSFETFLPIARVRRRRRNRWSVVSESLFPGYLFIRLDLELQNTASIRSTRGVVGLVSFGGRHRPFPGHILQSLMEAQSSFDGDPIEPMVTYKYGDPVELIDGPMVGLKEYSKLETVRRGW